MQHFFLSHGFAPFFSVPVFYLFPNLAPACTAPRFFFLMYIIINCAVILTFLDIILNRYLFWTSANSASLALSMFVSGKETPGRMLRTFWGVALGAVAAVLAGFGSLKTIQTASIATAFPLMFLLLLVIYGTFRGLNAHIREQGPPGVKKSV
jgi:choline-glycine betaine transporter